MANSPKGAGNILGPLAIVAVVVAIVLIATFSLTGEEPPEQPTVISEDVNGEPAGAGTMPEGEADETEEGVTDVIDEVDPAAPDEDSVPPADSAQEQSPDSNTEGEVNADETTSDTADEPVVRDQAPQNGGGESSQQGTEAATSSSEAGTGGADGELGDEPANTGGGDDDQSASESFLLDEESQGSEGENVDQPGSGDAEGFPEGRDADTDLNPSQSQDVIRDDDQGGTGFVPTPSGPEGRDGDTVAE